MAQPGAKLDKSLMGRSKREQIFSIIHRKGCISRVQISKLSNMSLMSVGRIVDELVNLGIVCEEEAGDQPNAVGRKPKMLRIASNNFLSVGVEIDRDRICAAIINFQGQVLKKLEETGDFSNNTPENVLRNVGKLIERIFSENKDLPVKQAVGVACPGLIDKNVIRFSSQMKWKNVAAADILRRYTGMEDIIVDNEVKAHGVAEDMFGLGKDCRSSVILTMGSGIGSSILIDHNLYRGRANMAGEIGHICINPSGNMCECGKRGCLQTYMADWAILRDARTVKENITLDEVFEAYRQGQPWAMNLFGRVLEYLSITISILSNTYSPDILILCGRLLEEHQVFKNIVLEHFCQNTDGDAVQVRTSNLGLDGTIIGAGTLAYYGILEKIL